MGNGVFLTGDITPKQQFLDTIGKPQIKMDIKGSVRLDIMLKNFCYIFRRRRYRIIKKTDSENHPNRMNNL